MNNTQNKSDEGSLLEVSLNLVNEKMHIIGQAGDNEPIHTDYIPPYGDNLGYMPLQLFLISLGACASGSVLVLLRKLQKNIKGLEVKAYGKRRTLHPTSFETITLDFQIVSPDVKPEDIDKVIAMSEASICPVWAMIKGNVEVEVKYQISLS
ncbi:MAG: OsmC family protein [Bacteroidales bacterium]|nr:OsmC family protein [Bacteroidales bacterium]